MKWANPQKKRSTGILFLGFVIMIGSICYSGSVGLALVRVSENHQATLDRVNALFEENQMEEARALFNSEVGHILNDNVLGANAVFITGICLFIGTTLLGLGFFMRDKENRALQAKKL